MILVVALLGYFCLIGLVARRLSAGVRWLVLVGIVALVMIDFATRVLP